MDTIDDGRRLRIYVCEGDEFDGRPLDEAIVDVLRAEGIGGATVLRGVAGYGGSAVLHTFHVLRLSEDLPVIVEAIDSRAKIEAILPRIESMVGDGLVTLEPVQIRVIRRED
ncbi:MAG: DUF190 domain-containing protein [Actinomycetota bacterium]